MECCSSQEIRKHLFENFNGRASYFSESPHANNSETMKRIINLRFDLTD